MVSKQFLRLFLLAMLFVQWTDEVMCSETTEMLNYKIVNKETLKKGGQLKPLIPPRYDFIRTYAALRKGEKLTEGNVKAVLKKIISEIRASDSPDAIVVYLHLSKSHVKSSIPFARAEWWPKGHSLSPDNAINIKNKKTYEISYNIDLPEDVSFDDTEDIPLPKRKIIYAELQTLLDKSIDLDGSLIDQGYRDTQRELKKRGMDEESISNRISKAYGITRKQLDDIFIEGYAEQWEW